MEAIIMEVLNSNKKKKIDRRGDGGGARWLS